MHFEAALGSADRAFRDGVRAFLDAELDPALVAAVDDERMFFGDYERSNAWLAKLKSRNYHVAHWPREHGGLGLSPLENYLLLYEQGLRGAPLVRPMGLNYVGPTIMRFGTDEQKADILPRIVALEDHWCQGFSEPGAGSDLARVATFAERRGDAYVVNGTKIWTTDGQYADRIFCLVRTSREDDKRALSFLLIDMRAPGVSVQPIRLVGGDHELNQVFFDDVEVLPDGLLGEEGGGWDVARYLLEIERGAFVFGGRLRRRLRRLVAHAERVGATRAFRESLLRLEIDLCAYEATELRFAHLGDAAETMPAAANVIKIEWTELLQRIDALALELTGRDGLGERRGASLYDAAGEIAMPGWLASYFNNLAASIYGGSNEVQRNLVYRALGRRYRG